MYIFKAFFRLDGLLQIVFGAFFYDKTSIRTVGIFIYSTPFKTIVYFTIFLPFELKKQD